MTAHGQLQHHFWGDYRATICLQFETPIDAAVAREHVFPTWKAHGRYPDVLVFHAGDPALAAEIAKLEVLGADRRKIESVAKSIDFGEPWDIEISGLDRPLAEAYGQRSLAF